VGHEELGPDRAPAEARHRQTRGPPSHTSTDLTRSQFRL
jgi:hypothetical protein